MLTGALSPVVEKIKEQRIKSLKHQASIYGYTLSPQLE